jgi:hypothetical protein
MRLAATNSILPTSSLAVWIELMGQGNVVDWRGVSMVWGLTRSFVAVGRRHTPGLKAWGNLKHVRRFVRCLSCRTGPLRVGRPFHGVFSFFSFFLFLLLEAFVYGCLAAGRFSVVPLPGYSCQIPYLNDQDGCIGSEEMPVLHGAHVEEGVPGHCGISKEASMA